MGEQSPIPVFVVHWNAPDWVRSTTESFLASSVATNVTVVDNGPYDAPLALDPRVHLVRTGSNRGYTGAANLGIAEWLAGDAPFCIVACHDVQLESRALERMLAFACDHSEYGIIAPEPVADIASGKRLAENGVVTDVAWASGSCLLLRRACVERIGAFDEDFGSYGEDIDLCTRARAAGWNVGIVRGAGARGAGSINPGFRAQMYVNQVRLRAKHAGSAAATRMLFAFPLLAITDAARGIVRRDRASLRRSGGRLRALPAATRLVWERRRSAR